MYFLLLLALLSFLKETNKYTKNWGQTTLGQLEESIQAAFQPKLIMGKGTLQKNLLQGHQTGLRRIWKLKRACKNAK